MSRDDLRVDTLRWNGCNQCWSNEYRDPTDADLASLGLVQAPECRECYGSGDLVEVYHPLNGDPPERSVSPCPSCGGTGFGRLIPVDGIDVEALRGALFTKLHVASTSDIAVVWNAAHSLLVAAGGCGDCTQCLDQEDRPYV